MSGIYYALSIVALFVIIRWCLANDHLGPNEPPSGLLAMKDDQAKTEGADTNTPGARDKPWRRDRERP